ncbi:replication protein A 70 kDa DNA-binding subunit B [Tanacetum coccineum]
MRPLRQSQRLSKSHQDKNSGVSVSNSESSSTGGQSEQKKNKKRSSSSSSDFDFQGNRGSKCKSGLEFARNNGSNTMHSSSNIVRKNSNNATRSALKSFLKRNNGKNVSIFENSPQTPMMKKRIITPIKDINPMIANMAIKGGCISVWHFHKLNEIHDLYSLDCVFQDEEVNEPFSCILDTNNKYHDHDCVDVIGTIVSIGDIVPVNGYGCSKVRRTVVIEDIQSLRLECTFWDKWALMWNEYAEKLKNKPAIHNALFGTRIFINKDITPLQSFRKSYEAKTGYNASEFKIEIHNPDSHVVTPTEFMQGCFRKMVGMIRDIEPETYCVVYATIHSIQYENGWAYIACKSCNTKVTPIQSKVGSSSRNKKQLLHYKNHRETYAVVSRFKIIVRVFDESGFAQVVLFDNNVYKMTKLSAWKIMEEQGMDVNQYFPDDLNQIIRKQYMFKIKYSQFNHNNNSHVYRAEKFVDNQTLQNEEGNITSQKNEENKVDDYTVQNEKDDHTSPSVEINENVQDEFKNNKITTTNEEASEPGKKTNIVYIDLSDYETEDEEEDLNTSKKLATIKLGKNP